MYECLREHPEIACPPTDSIHYYDMHFHRGPEWYASHFEHAGPGQKLFDPTPSYLRSPWAARRIARDHPDARILLCLRHPADRAFSHWWHERKKGRHSFEFGEVLENYDLFSAWLEPGFYAEHLERFLEHFPRGRVRALRFGTLERDPRAFLDEILEFAGLDRDFEPTLLGVRRNPAGGRATAANRAWRALRAAAGRLGVGRALRRAGLADFPNRIERLPGIGRLLAPRDEYEAGIPGELRERLEELCEPEIRRTERLLGVDLSGWRS